MRATGDDMVTFVKVQKYESLVSRLRGYSFSWRVAKKIVGGEKRLRRLIEEEKIHGYKPPGSYNSQWKLDAAEVISNVKPLV